MGDKEVVSACVWEKWEDGACRRCTKRSSDSYMNMGAGARNLEFMFSFY